MHSEFAAGLFWLVGWLRVRAAGDLHEEVIMADKKYHLHRTTKDRVEFERDADEIDRLLDDYELVEWEEFDANVDWEKVAARLGYDEDLPLSEDHHVSFGVGEFYGFRVYVLRHSETDFIFADLEAITYLHGKTEKQLSDNPPTQEEWNRVNAYGHTPRNSSQGSSPSVLLVDEDEDEDEDEEGGEWAIENRAIWLSCPNGCFAGFQGRFPAVSQADAELDEFGVLLCEEVDTDSVHVVIRKLNTVCCDGCGESFQVADTWPSVSLADAINAYPQDSRLSDFKPNDVVSVADDGDVQLWLIGVTREGRLGLVDGKDVVGLPDGASIQKYQPGPELTADELEYLLEQAAVFGLLREKFPEKYSDHQGEIRFTPGSLFPDKSLVNVDA